jgi:hypothetical protein
MADTMPVFQGKSICEFRALDTGAIYKDIEGAHFRGYSGHYPTPMVLGGDI